MNPFRLPPDHQAALYPARHGAAWMAAALFTLAAPHASAQTGSGAGVGGIYTCVDAHGRLTSDRPIMACSDREQRELNRSGTTKRVIGPILTAKEREAEEARRREAELERQRARDAIRRDEALLTRYPNQAAHDEGRKQTLAQTQIVVDAAQGRIAELAKERKGLDDEMEFYRKDPAKAPAKVRRAVEANAEAVAVQQRAIDGQQAERARINAHYDAQLVRLKALWATHDKPTPPPTPARAAPASDTTR